ncbi:MAG: hypothetical protein OXC44_06050 [Proteobacteria bacterium]|nr:hypothetical protein [Pseudomonadota bacterium]
MRLLPPQEPARAAILTSVTRIATSCLISLLGAFLVDDPEGLLGVGGKYSLTGAVLSVFWITISVLAIIGFSFKLFWATSLAWLVMFSSVGVFALAMPVDTWLAGILVFYQAYLGAVTFMYARPLEPEGHSAFIGFSDRRLRGYNPYRVWMQNYAPALSHVVLISAISLLLTYGFKVTELKAVSNAIVLYAAVALLLTTRFLYMLIRYHPAFRTLGVILVILALSAISLFGVWGGILSQIFMFMYFITVLSFLVAENSTVRDILENFQSAPALLVLFSFAVLISLGSLFLYLPAASATGSSITFMQALFTAISATCVTGLTVVNISEVFSEFGRFVILGLMQVGGLGIMVLSTFATIALGGKLGVRTEKAFSEFFSRKGMKSTSQLIIFIVISTVIIELIGAAIIGYQHYHSVKDPSFYTSLKLGIFQAVSAFCNAGFSLTDDSLTHLHGSPVALAAYGVLIVLGGMGFVVLFELISRLFKRTHITPLSVQTKVVVVATVVFVVAGGVLFLMLEWDSALASLSLRDKIMNSFFHSITLRTAGFNTLPLELFTYPSFVVMLLFMFVGGAPAGTAGGVKVTTFATLLATLPTLIRNDNRVMLFSRNFSMQTVAKSSALIILSFSTIGVLWFLLLLTQDLPPMLLLFEIFSASGTVGLTLGITDKLDLVGQVIIAIGMFIGRIGPLTLAIALASDDRSRINFPSAEVMIG